MAKTEEYYKRHREEQRRWRTKNLEKNKEIQRKSYLKFKYGLTVEDYNDLLETQNYKCAICESDPIIYSNLSIDHCHETGKIRGLLCQNCNSAIGFLKEDPEVVLKAYQYLQEVR